MTPENRVHSRLPAEPILRIRALADATGASHGEILRRLVHEALPVLERRHAVALDEQAKREVAR